MSGLDAREASRADRDRPGRGASPPWDTASHGLAQHPVRRQHPANSELSIRPGPYRSDVTAAVTATRRDSEQRGTQASRRSAQWHDSRRRPETDRSNYGSEGRAEVPTAASLHGVQVIRWQPGGVRERVTGIIERRGRILVVQQRARGESGRHDGQLYLTLSGGGVEIGESLETALGHARSPKRSDTSACS